MDVRNDAALSAMLFNLGIAQFDLGEYRKAQELYERALRIQEREYGTEHRVVAPILADLAKACGRLGNAALQRELLERAHRIVARWP